MTDIRLVVSDIDGTLVRNDKTLSDAVIAAVGRLQAAGIGFALISARPPSGMLWIAERLNITGLIGAFNGGTIVRPDGTIVSAAYLDRDAVAKTLDLIDRPGIDPWLFRDGRWYARTLAGDHVGSERKAANVVPVIVSEMRDMVDRVDKLVGVSDDHDLLARIEPDVASALGGGATVARSQPYYLDVTAARANKGDGLAELARVAGVPLDQVAVFGDQFNDLPMFARAGCSFVMGQAPDAVKKQASSVVSSNEDDGVAMAIDRLLKGVPHAR